MLSGLIVEISGLLDEFNNNPNVSEFFHSLKIYLNKILEDPSLRLGQVTVTQVLNLSDLILQGIQRLSR